MPRRMPVQKLPGGLDGDDGGGKSASSRILTEERGKSLPDAQGEFGRSLRRCRNAGRRILGSAKTRCRWGTGRITCSRTNSAHRAARLAEQDGQNPRCLQYQILQPSSVVNIFQPSYCPPTNIWWKPTRFPCLVQLQCMPVGKRFDHTLIVICHVTRANRDMYRPHNAGDKLRAPKATVSFIALLGGPHLGSQQSTTLSRLQPRSGVPYPASRS